MGKKCVYLLNLVKNPCFVVVYSVILHCLVGEMFFESVNNFNLFEHNIHSAWSTARDVVHFVSLDCNLNVFDSSDERDHEIPAWLLIAVNYSTTSEVYANMALLHSVHSWENNQRRNNEESKYKFNHNFNYKGQSYF
jgi:hypothetical protein